MTITTHLWIQSLGAFVQRLLGIAFDLSGLDIDEGEIDLDLGYGRE